MKAAASSRCCLVVVRHYILQWSRRKRVVLHCMPAAGAYSCPPGPTEASVVLNPRLSNGEGLTAKWQRCRLGPRKDSCLRVLQYVALSVIIIKSSSLYCRKLSLTVFKYYFA